LTGIYSRDSMNLMTKKDPSAFITNEVLNDAIDTILEGMDNMLIEQKKIFATKEDLKQCATKEDLKDLVTKDDLKREVSWLRDDIKGLSADLSNTPNRKEFNGLKGRVDKLEATIN